MESHKRVQLREIRRKPIHGTLTPEPQTPAISGPNPVPFPTSTPATPSIPSDTEVHPLLSHLGVDHHNALAGKGLDVMSQPAQPRVNQAFKQSWKPFSTKWPYLSVMFVLVTTLLALVASFHGYRLVASKSGEGHLPKSKRFAIFYLPYMLCSILSQLLQGVDVEVRAMHPFVLIARDKGALAQESICLDYVSKNSIVALVSAMRHRHWLVATSAGITTLSSMVYPLIATSFFRFEGDAEEFVVSSRPAAVGAGIFFASIQLVLLGLLTIQCHRVDTRIQETPYSIGYLAALARNEDFRANWLRFPPSTTAETIQKNLEKHRIRLEHGTEGPYLNFLPQGHVHGQEVILKPEDRAWATCKPTTWSKLRFWEWNPRQAFVFQKGPLLLVTVFLFPGVWAPLKLGFGLSPIPFDAKRVVFAVLGAGLKIYAELMDLEHRFAAPFIPNPTKGSTNGPDPSRLIITIPRSSINSDFITTRPLIAPLIFFRSGVQLLGLSALMPLCMEMWTVICGLNPAFLMSPSGKESEMQWLLYELADVAGVGGALVGFIFGLIAMTYMAAMLQRSYTPVTYPLPRKPASIADRISYIHASHGLFTPQASSRLASALDTSCVEAKDYTLGLYEGRNGDLQLRLDETKNCIRTFLPWCWYKNVGDAVVGTPSRPPQQLDMEDDDAKPLNEANEV